MRPSGYEPDELPTAPPRDIKYGAEDRNRTGTRGKSRRILSPVRLPVPPLRHTTWLRATLPGGRPPSTIAAKELNFCVRYGNRCFPRAMGTNSAPNHEAFIGVHGVSTDLIFNILVKCMR